MGKGAHHHFVKMRAVLPLLLSVAFLVIAVPLEDADNQELVQKTIDLDENGIVEVRVKEGISYESSRSPSEWMKTRPHKPTHKPTRKPAARTTKKRTTKRPTIKTTKKTTKRPVTKRTTRTTRSTRRTTPCMPSSTTDPRSHRWHNCTTTSTPRPTRKTTKRPKNGAQMFNSASVFLISVFVAVTLV